MQLAFAIARFITVMQVFILSVNVPNAAIITVIIQHILQKQILSITGNRNYARIHGISLIGTENINFKTIFLNYHFNMEIKWQYW